MAAVVVIIASHALKAHEAFAGDEVLGLPPLKVPEDNAMTPEKIALGEKLFNDKRFSSSGKVSCATCHEVKKAFTDSPLKTSVGINGLTGTRNAPTLLNAAFNETQFWDGRSPSLEDQALHPFTNPVEMGLASHQPIIDVIRGDTAYLRDFKKIFGISAAQITMTEVTQAIASFERTLISGNSRFDRWYFRQEPVLSEQEIRGFKIFLGNGRCVSCHVIEQTTALFTDNRFHNIGVGINRVPERDVARLTREFLKAKYRRAEVDRKVLANKLVSELGRFAVTVSLTEIGAFKTPTLRNIALTAPYMHDGSLATLEEVIEHYDRGGASSANEKINPYLDGGIRPLKLTEQETADLVAFMKSLNGNPINAGSVEP